MRALAVLLVLAAAAFAAYLGYGQGEATAPPDGPDTHMQDAATRAPERRADPGAADAARPATPPPGTTAPAGGTPPATPGTPRPAAPTTALGKRLGWTDEQARPIEAWHRELATEQSGFIDELTDGGGAPTAKEFNERMGKRRRDLVERIGIERANMVLGVLPVYEFDMTDGTWHRVDAQGGRLPFQDETQRGRFEAFKPK